MLSKTFAIAAVSLLALGGAANADLSISNKPTRNMSCDAGVCTATAQKAVLNVGELQTMLASGDITVKTGSVALNIEIVRPLKWNTASRLTLDAQQSISVKKPVIVNGTGAISITTSDGSSGGGLQFERDGRIDFLDLNSSLVINGDSYILVRNIKSLAEQIGANPSGYFALAKNYDALADGRFKYPPISILFTGVLRD